MDLGENELGPKGVESQANGPIDLLVNDIASGIESNGVFERDLGEKELGVIMEGLMSEALDKNKGAKASVTESTFGIENFQGSFHGVIEITSPVTAKIIIDTNLANVTSHKSIDSHNLRIDQKANYIVKKFLKRKKVDDSIKDAFQDPNKSILNYLSTKLQQDKGVKLDTIALQFNENTLHLGLIGPPSETTTEPEVPEVVLPETEPPAPVIDTEPLITETEAKSPQEMRDKIQRVDEQIAEISRNFAGGKMTRRSYRLEVSELMEDQVVNYETFEMLAQKSEADSSSAIKGYVDSSKELQNTARRLVIMSLHHTHPKRQEIWGKQLAKYRRDLVEMKRIYSERTSPPQVVYKQEQPPEPKEATLEQKAKELIDQEKMIKPEDALSKLNSAQMKLEAIHQNQGVPRGVYLQKLEGPIENLELGIEAFKLLSNENGEAPERVRQYVEQSKYILAAAKGLLSGKELAHYQERLLGQIDFYKDFLPKPESPKLEQEEPLTPAGLQKLAERSERPTEVKKPETRKESALKLIEQNNYTHPIDILDDLARSSQASSDAYEEFITNPNLQNTSVLRIATRKHSVRLRALNRLASNNQEDMTKELKDTMGEYFSTGQRLVRFNLNLLDEKDISKREEITENQDNQRRKVIELQAEAKTKMDEVVDLAKLSPDELFDRLVDNQSNLVEAMDEYKSEFQRKPSKRKPPAERKELQKARKDLQQTIFENRSILDFINTKMNESEAYSKGKFGELLGEFAFMEKRLVKLAHGMQDNMDNRILLNEIEKEKQDLEQEQKKVVERMVEERRKESNQV